MIVTTRYSVYAVDERPMDGRLRYFAVKKIWDRDGRASYVPIGRVYLGARLSFRVGDHWNVDWMTLDAMYGRLPKAHLNQWTTSQRGFKIARVVLGRRLFFGRCYRREHPSEEDRRVYRLRLEGYYSDSSRLTSFPIGYYCLACERAEIPDTWSCWG